MSRYLSAVLFLFGTFFSYQLTAQLGIVCVPVADLVGQSQPLTVYRELPLGTQPVTQCTRMHQLLYNEIVNIEQETADEVLISIRSLFFKTEPKGNPQTMYWTQKKNIRALAALKKNGITQPHLPAPIDFSDSASIAPTDDTVTLLYPWHDHASGRTYSAGTRFIINKEAPTPKGMVCVFMLAKNKQHELTGVVPKKYLFFKKAYENEREAFVRIIHAWSHNDHGCIPYVWGGSSYTERMPEEHFIKKKNKNYAQFLPLRNQKRPLSGFDCAGLISRAAQIAGIPFFYKNTTTILHNLPIISTLQDLKAGDLIWFPGHVMIISDVARARCIEARGYSHGYGKVHEIQLKDVFKNIASYQQLLNASQAKQRLYRLQKDGTCAHAVDGLVLLKLPTP